MKRTTSDPKRDREKGPVIRSVRRIPDPRPNPLFAMAVQALSPSPIFLERR